MINSFLKANKIASSRQVYYPSQAYNKIAQIELVDWIESKHKTILDLGCGNGGMLRMIAERYPDSKLSGLSVNDEERKACAKYGFDIRLGDAHDMPWEDDTFDLIVARHMLEHSVSPLTVLIEANRTLKPGGDLIICVPGIESEWVVKWEDHFSVLSKVMWEKLFADAGFEIVRSDTGTWLASYSMKEEIEYRFYMKKVRSLEVDGSGEDNQENIGNNSNVETIAPNLPLIADQSKIAFMIHNIVLFETIQPILDELKNRSIRYDIYIPSFENELWRSMAQDTYMHLVSKGYQPEEIGKVPEHVYKIAFYPYLPYSVEVLSEYKVRYQYGMAKPEWNFGTWSLNFDIILCNGPYDKSFLSAYAETIIVGPLKFAGFELKAKTRSDKINVLYLPTYGEYSSIEHIKDELIAMGDSFNITIKLHHGTSYLERERVKAAYEITQNVFDHKKSILELMNNCDVILSDGSGAIFDAIAADIPIAIFQPINPPKFEGVPSLEERIIIENLVPYASKTEELKIALTEALEKKDFVEKRKKLRGELFPIVGEKSVELVMLQIDRLLNDEIDMNYFLAHNKLRNKMLEIEQSLRAAKIAKEQVEILYKQQKVKLLSDINEMMIRINNLKAEINEKEIEREANNKRLEIMESQVNDKNDQIMILKNEISELQANL